MKFADLKLETDYYYQRSATAFAQGYEHPAKIRLVSLDRYRKGGMKWRPEMRSDPKGSYVKVTFVGNPASDVPYYHDDREDFVSLVQIRTTWDEGVKEARERDAKNKEARDSETARREEQETRLASIKAAAEAAGLALYIGERSTSGTGGSFRVAASDLEAFLAALDHREKWWHEARDAAEVKGYWEGLRAAEGLVSADVEQGVAERTAARVRAAEDATRATGETPAEVAQRHLDEEAEMARYRDAADPTKNLAE